MYLSGVRLGVSLRKDTKRKYVLIIATKSTTCSLSLSLSKREATVESSHVFIQDPHSAWRFFHVPRWDKCKSYWLCFILKETNALKWGLKLVEGQKDLNGEVNFLACRCCSLKKKQLFLIVWATPWPTTCFKNGIQAHCQHTHHPVNELWPPLD